MNRQEFTLYLRENYFVKSDILSKQNGTELIVTKVYKNRWWRKLLRWFGFPIAHYQCKIKVKTNE